MRSLLLVQEPPAGNVLTVELRYVSPTPKRVRSAIGFSARPACHSIKQSTLNPHRQTTPKHESEKVRKLQPI